jgi:cobalt-precorrin-6B (C15)-methyltransferase
MRMLRDNEFIRGEIPMTKFITRTAVMGFLQLEKNELLLDIGAGTGSISLQAGILGARVVAIEREKSGVELIERNMERFNVDIKLIQGEAPHNLPEQVVDKCFIGGSGGHLDQIFEYLDRNLKEDGILCATFITLTNLNRFRELLKLHRYRDIEGHMVQSSEISNVGMLRGNNPVFIVKGVK